MANSKRKLTEEDLARHVIDWLEEQHWDIYQEVSFGQGAPTVDIVAKQNYLIWMIEVKTTLNLDVLAQAEYNRFYAHFSSVAVPGVKREHYNRGRKMAYGICRNLGIGLLVIDERESPQWRYMHEGPETIVEVKTKVRPALHRSSHRMATNSVIPILRPEHKTHGKAGTNRGGYFTPYRATMNEVRSIMEKSPGCTIKEIMEKLTQHHYAHDKSALASIQAGLRQFEDWCRIETVGNTNHYYVEETDK